jgi:hypothetical protein
MAIRPHPHAAYIPCFVPDDIPGRRAVGGNTLTNLKGRRRCAPSPTDKPAVTTVEWNIPRCPPGATGESGCGEGVAEAAEVNAEMD